MSAQIHPVYNVYCSECAEGYGPFDEEPDAEDSAAVHDAESHNEPDRTDADYDHFKESLRYE